jgi:hypothetical protein
MQRETIRTTRYNSVALILLVVLKSLPNASIDLYSLNRNTLRFTCTYHLLLLRIGLGAQRKCRWLIAVVHTDFESTVSTVVAQKCQPVSCDARRMMVGQSPLAGLSARPRTFAYTHL